ncbi:hypothetical protein LINPERHAP2_LOCUS18923 [Linum perenne]
MWKSRNDLVFNGINASVQSIAYRITSWVKVVEDELSRDHRLDSLVGHELREVRWDPGPDDWLIINTDGSVRHPSGEVAAGGLLLIDGSIINHHHALEVIQFRELQARSWEIRLRHTYREGNRAANFLANLGHQRPIGLHSIPVSDCNLGFHLLSPTQLPLSLFQIPNPAPSLPLPDPEPSSLLFQIGTQNKRNGGWSFGLQEESEKEELSSVST